jgi:hypothetical protein
MRWATARIIKTAKFARGVVIPFEMNAPEGFIYFSNVKQLSLVKSQNNHDIYYYKINGESIF